MQSSSVHLLYVHCLLEKFSQRALGFRLKQDKFHLHVVLRKPQRLAVLEKKAMEGTH